MVNFSSWVECSSEQHEDTTVETKQKYIRDVITVLGLEEAKPCDDSECEEDGNDRITR